MNRTILGAAGAIAISLSTPALAADIRQAAVALFVYHTDCAPLTGKLLETTKLIIGAMDERERTRALMAVVDLEAGNKEEFCAAMAPQVKKLSE